MDATENDRCLDFDVDNRIRREIWQQMAELNAIKLTRALWAFVWMAEADVLRKEFLEADIKTRRDKMAEWHTTTMLVVKRWCQKPVVEKDKSTISTPTTNPTEVYSPRRSSIRGGPTYHRRQGLTERALHRDGKSCVLSGVGEALEVAHIYPWCLMRRTDDGVDRDQRKRIWEGLSVFFGEEKRDQWYEEFRTTEIGHYEFVDMLENLVTLTRNTHATRNDAAWVLKPVGKPGDTVKDDDGQDCIKVLFLWLDGKMTNAIDDEMRSDEPPPNNLAPLYRRDGAPIIESKWDRNSSITSGTSILISTPNKDEYPLPSWHLLNLQYHLTRLRHLAGAAEDKVDKDDSSDDDVET